MGTDGMKLASLFAALLLALALVFPAGVHAQAVQQIEPGDEVQPLGEEALEPLDTDPIVEDQPVTRPFGDVQPEQAAGIWGNLPDLPVIGTPVPGGLNYQPAVTSLAHEIHTLSHAVHVVMIAIVVFVIALIGFALVRFNSRVNPTPARFTHNTRLEIFWTLGPVLILIGIGSFALPVLFRQLEIPENGQTIKITGYQWFWGVEYPDNELSYEMFMLDRDSLEENGYHDAYYLLATDAAMVVPVDTVIKLQVTAADVIHAFAMPSFGLKLDAIPGRLNELWFEVEEEGVYFGQCSELCGLDHAYMPITVKAVSQEDYAAWLDWAIDEYGGVRAEPEVAAAN